jgi:ATP-dependent helicase/DNAse subunit B
VKWLVERVLRAQGIDPDAQPLTRGSFAHAVLERTFAGVREEHGSARITPETLPTAERLLDAAVAGVCEEEEFVLAPTRAESRAVARRVQVQVRRLLRHEARGDSPFEPRHLELTFGFEGEGEAGDEGGEPSLPPLELGGGRLQVRGRIDRVDVAPDTGRAMVRDYKAGEAKSEHGEKKWREAGQLQVALYMLAVQRLLGHEVVGGVYQSLQGPDLRARGLLLDAPDVRALTETTLRDGDVREPETFAAALDAAEQAALELGAAMRAGRLEPCPDSCGYGGGGCAYPGICRSEDA